MKRILTCLVLALSILTASTQRSHAVVGLATANPSLATVGGLIGAGSITIGAIDPDDLGTAFFAWFFVIVGLTLLNENQEAEIVFSPLSNSTDFSAHEISVYNSELLELNSIRQSITSELKADPKLDASELWDQYSYALSPETLHVARSTARKLVNKLKK